MSTPFADQARFLGWCVVALLGLDVTLAALWSAKWVSLVSGFVGSLALAVPPARIELEKMGRRRLEELTLPRDLEELRAKIDREASRRIEGWHASDSLLIFFGAALLCCSFVAGAIDALRMP